MCNNTIIYKFIIVVLSIIIGITAAILFLTGNLSNIFFILPVFVLIAVIVLAFIIVLILIPSNRKKPLSKCLCNYGGLIVFSSIFTIGLALLALSVGIGEAIILSAILIDATVAAFFGVLLGLLFFIFCLLNKKCGFSNSNNCCCCCCCNNTNSANSDTCGFDLE